MAIIIDGTTGVSGVDGSAGTPAYQGTDSNTGITFPAADTVGISTSGTERLRIDSSGNLGLGVIPSNSQVAAGRKTLEIGSAGNALFGYSTSDFTMSSGAYYDTSDSWKYSVSSKPVSYYGQVNGVHRWAIAASGTAGNTITFTQAMTLDASGNLGIGTTSQSTRLGVLKSSSTAYNPSTAALNYVAEFKNSTSGASNNALVGFFTESNGEWYIGSVQNAGNTQSDFVFVARDNSAGGRFERLRIDASGNVGIGTTSPTSYASKTLEVYGSSIATLKLTNATTGIGNTAGFELEGDGNNLTIVNRTSSGYTRFFNNGSERARIHASGGVSINNTTDPGAGNLSVTGSISDSIGDVRTIIQNAQSGAGSYTLVATDAGKHIYVTGTGGVTMPVSVFSVGQAITIVNNTSSSITITGPAAGTMYLAGTATTGNRTLAQRGICTALYVVAGATPTIIISGSGLT